MSTQILLEQFPFNGQIEWIGIRSDSNTSMVSLDHVYANADKGLKGDRYQGRSGKRHVTLIQQEHLDVVSALTRQTITAELLRRNLLVSGINLIALRNQYFQIGEVLLEGTGYCHPCSKIERRIANGAYNAMRGHGGITARIIKSGYLRISDSVTRISNKTID